MRVYLPATRELLTQLSAGARIDGPFDAVAVTPGLREWFATSDADDLEYAAMARAADLALELADQGMRIVVVADAAEADATVVDDPVGTVTVGALDESGIASFHVDDVDAIPAVTAARRALSAAPAGTAPVEVEALDDYELAWFARQELDAVLALLTR